MYHASNIISLCVLQLVQTYIAFDDIIRICGDVSGKAKITDFGHSSFSQ